MLLVTNGAQSTVDVTGFGVLPVSSNAQRPRWSALEDWWNRSCPGDVWVGVGDLLFLSVALAPFLAPCVVLGTAVALVRRACKQQLALVGRLPSVATCILVAVMGSAAAFGAYSWGVMSGFYILDPDQMCAAKGVPGDHIVTRWTLPVSAQCVTSDGVGTELAPGWVNPVIFIGLVLLLLALGTGTLAAVRRHLSSR
ncbi:hypothetical protein [Streptomyces naphthomycinicus]|uniref:hypothetical protein n=1 Tax=Streptomyces naphthomycinicus TaxID=2872625 RepID=UPI001CED1FA5|nr:hypothetical protein [Streptomyces sp. TML10]